MENLGLGGAGGPVCTNLYGEGVFEGNILDKSIQNVPGAVGGCYWKKGTVLERTAPCR